MVEIRTTKPADKFTDIYMEILQELVKSVGLEGAVLASADGIPIASALRRGIEEDRIAVISAAALTLGLKIAEEINKGVLEQIIVRSDNGLALINGIGDKAVLTAVADEKVKLGFLMMEVKRAHARIAKLLLTS